jgi:hypothetical protein
LDRVLYFFPVSLDPPTWAARITGVQHHIELICWGGVLLTFILAGLKPWSSLLLLPKELGTYVSHCTLPCIVSLGNRH